MQCILQSPRERDETLNYSPEWKTKGPVTSFTLTAPARLRGLLAAFVSLRGIQGRRSSARCTGQMQQGRPMYIACSPREPHVVPVRRGMYRDRDIFSLYSFLSPALLVGSARSASKPPAPRRHHPAARLARLARLGKGRPRRDVRFWSATNRWRQP